MGGAFLDLISSVFDRVGACGALSFGELWSSGGRVCPSILLATKARPLGRVAYFIFIL